MTRRRRTGGPTALLAAGLLTLSCSTNRMYRSVSVEEHPDYTLAFIEFDDQGELWAPSQLDRALARLEQLNRAEAGVAFVLFAHGWNGDASPKQERNDKSILSRYKATLSRLAEGLRQELPQLDLPIMGVYLAWRGRVSSVPLLRQASFYNRRGAAERVAGPPATEAIYRLLVALRRNPVSRSVLVGHSFGSIILERALAQAVVSALLAAPGREVIFPADLVVLLNPAGSASQTKQLVDILVRNRVKTYRLGRDGTRFERPLLVSFTSEKDRATRRFFPGGMRVKAMTKKFRAYGREYCSPISNQRSLYTRTAGHLPALHSHEVTVGPKSGRLEPEPPPDRLVPNFLRYEEEVDPLTRELAFSFDGEKERFTIKRKPLALNDTPYWIMRVPRELIPNHSAVLTEDTYRLLEAVLVLTATYDADVTTIVEREVGVRPVAVVPRLDGTALMVDRSRAVYAVRRDSTHPVFLSCLSDTIDPDTAIGFHIAGPLAYAVVMTPRQGGADERCHTELYEFEIDEDGYRQVLRKRFAGADCYTAATVDLRQKRALLSLDTDEGPRLRAVDLTEEMPRAREFLDLPGTRAPTVLHFEDSRRRLFAARGDSGELWEIDLTAAEPGPRPIEHDMDLPLNLAYSHPDQRLYVSDAGGRKIWAFDCERQCGEPTVFLQSDAFRNPTTLAVAVDGTVWLGDLESQTLWVISPAGKVEHTIRSLSGNPSEF